MKVQRFVIIMILITALGVFFSWTYEKPDTKVYSSLNQIDTAIETAQNQQDQSLVSTLNQFHQTIQTIINEAQTYDKKSPISFEAYNSQFSTLHRINNDLTKALETSTTQLEKISSDLNEAITTEKERLTALEQLNIEIGATLSYLQNFEEMVYTPQTKTAKAYLQELQNHFTNIQNYNNQYAELSNSYFSLKTDLYQQLNQ